MTPATRVFVISGPSGVGKGTLVARLVASDPRLWLSRSWTTRPRRPSDPPDAYLFVDRRTFAAHQGAGGFLETNCYESNGEWYGTPVPDPPAGADVVFEIDVNGARQVKGTMPAAVAVLVLAPSTEALAERLARRGDPPDQVARRLAIAAREEAAGRALADHVVVNDDLDRAVAELGSIIESHRHNPGVA
ncbi:MAG: guanylate kinase [Acidimicrobiales bacterium]